MKLLFLLLLTFFSKLVNSQLTSFSCSYDSRPINVYKYFDRNFPKDEEIEKYVTLIVQQVGLEKNFLLISNPTINNCVATNFKGLRVIIYDKRFLDNLNQQHSSKKWIYLSILAHEVGHHLQGHTLRKPASYEESQEMELEADKFSGFILQRLGASLQQASESIMSLKEIPLSAINTSTHPNKQKRLTEVNKGYNEALSYKNKILSDNIETLKIQKDLMLQKEIGQISESLFDKAQNAIRNDQLQEANEILTTIIQIDKTFISDMALNQRGAIRLDLNDTIGALTDFNTFISKYSPIISKENNRDTSSLDKILLQNTYYNRGSYFFTKRDFVKAKKDFMNSYTLSSSKHVSSLVRYYTSETALGECGGALKNINIIETYFHNNTKKDKTDSLIAGQYYYGLMVCSYSKNEYKESYYYLSKSLIEGLYHPKRVEMLISILFNGLSEEQYIEALKKSTPLFAKIVENEPTNPSAFFLYGSSLEANGIQFFDKALEAYLQAIKLEKTALNFSNAARIYKAKGDLINYNLYSKKACELDNQFCK